MKLGQPVTAIAYLARRTGYPENRRPGDVLKVWRRVAFDAPKPGVLIGLRVLSNGWRSYDSEEGMLYQATEYQHAALVAFSLRTRPQLVALADMMESKAQVATIPSDSHDHP